MTQEPTHNLNFRSGMLQSWNKFCFTGGYIEVSMSMPGSSKAMGCELRPSDSALVLADLFAPHLVQSGQEPGHSATSDDQDMEAPITACGHTPTTHATWERSRTRPSLTALIPSRRNRPAQMIMEESSRGCLVSVSRLARAQERIILDRT